MSAQCMKGTQGLFALSNCCKTRSEDDIICMPGVYSQDLRWKVCRNLRLWNRWSESFITNINENNFSICAKVSYARPCRHGCNQQAISLHSDALTRRARYHGRFATTPREKALCMKYCTRFFIIGNATLREKRLVFYNNVFPFIF